MGLTTKRAQRPPGHTSHLHYKARNVSHLCANGHRLRQRAQTGPEFWRSVSSKPSAGANSNTVTTSVVHANTDTCVFMPHRDTKSHVCTHTQRALNRVLSHQQGVCRFEDITWKTLGTGLTLGLGSL